MKIMVVSTSRADVGSLKPIFESLVDAGHLVEWVGAESGSRYDGRESLTHINSVITGFIADRLVDSAPDLVVLLGDRYETLAVATAAFLSGLPIAHLSGGDVTQGSQDDSMRHAITKLSHLHFVTHQTSADRVIQLGEDPSRVHVTGCPGIDSLLRIELLSKEEVMAAVGLKGLENYFLVSLHPNTLAPVNKSDHELDQLIAALKIQLSCYTVAQEHIGIVLTDPNKDAGHQLIEDKFSTLANKNEVVYCSNLDRKTYLSLMKHCVALVGNSSAGFYEAPSLGTKVINVGDRQKGRIPASSTRDCSPNAYDIYGMMRAAELNHWPQSIPSNPYGDGKAAERIASIISSIKHSKELLQKKFFDLPQAPSWRSVLSGNTSIKNVSGDGTQRKSLSDGLLGPTMPSVTEVRSSS